METNLVMSSNVNGGPEARLSAEELKLFNEQGFLGPYDLFGAEEAHHLFERFFNYPRLLLPWKKGRHIVVKELAQAASHPYIVKKAVSILGEDVLLWGSILIRQPSSVKHPMHVDVEHTEWDGITVWIAMQNVLRGSSFSVISGSHLFGTSPQQLQQSHGLNCNDDKAVLEAAQKINPDSKLVRLNVSDGQFILFSGKLWHGTQNTGQKLRSSVVLQYTSPKSKVKIPKTYDMPIKNWLNKEPLCMLVHGEDKYKRNKLIETESIGSTFHLLKSLFFYFPSNLIESLKSKM